MTFQSLTPSKALSFLSHPVTIITANDGKLKNGMTAAWQGKGQPLNWHRSKYLE